ncbi:MAG: ribonuclease III [Hydrogenophaga sp.]|uniref:ribonuclease III n=1 Tax=Hydrogenophaga sp. TaxID=1904254 RepID=UPI0016A40916|nr:ribonuclease III [Hydrogenophaga sp.]NIM42600.1 ribonuclease III [Hydrogenophaga sp.]NIN25643.1 ribonuclease III [Hydrogenophaga sp.]NIN30305.1 ribonuclease III [Hydrogenophaga sp.]NIN56645.1 ribonuclease III [Hydrogenophaga sp.]NIO53220.1 ribonuclease III [Hydrogenophaga sp.]
MNPDLTALQGRLQHRFANPRLLERALTHRSFGADHNERLEFLGDSVLNLAVSGLLFEKLNALPEGDLSRVRANLVKQDTLFELAQALGLSSGLRLGDGEKRSGGHKRPSILADALEAVIGAVYLDAGFETASQLVRRLYSGVELSASMTALGKDPKTELQEWLQGRKMKLPVYRVVATLGEAHKQTFDVECTVQETGHSERGIGASRRAGEQAAAAAMLQHLSAPSADKATP